MYDFVGLYDLKHTFRGKRQFPDRFGLQEELYKLVAEEGSWLVYQCQNKKKQNSFVSVEVIRVNNKWEFQDALDIDVRKKTKEE